MSDFDLPNCGFRRVYPDWNWKRWKRVSLSRETTTAAITISKWTTLDLGPLQLLFRKVTLRTDDET